MKRPEDEILFKDMVDHARRAIAAVAGRRREDLDTDDVLAAALERFIEVTSPPLWLPASYSRHRPSRSRLMV
jgi:hypothetical protein